MSGILTTLRERGFIRETTNDEGLEALLESGSVSGPQRVRRTTVPLNV